VARAAYLDQLVDHVDDFWERVEATVATKRPAEHDRAVKVITM